MKVKVHWVIDGVAEVEAESLEDAEKIINEKLSDFVSSNPDIEENGCKGNTGKGTFRVRRRRQLFASIARSLANPV